MGDVEGLIDGWAVGTGRGGSYLGPLRSSTLCWAIVAKRIKEVDGFRGIQKFWRDAKDFDACCSLTCRENVHWCDRNDYMGVINKIDSWWWCDGDDHEENEPTSFPRIQHEAVLRRHTQERPIIVIVIVCICFYHWFPTVFVCGAMLVLNALLFKGCLCVLYYVFCVHRSPSPFVKCKIHHPTCSINQSINMYFRILQGYCWHHRKILKLMNK